MESRARTLDATSRSLQAASAAASREAEADCCVGRRAKARRGARDLVGLCYFVTYPQLLCSAPPPASHSQGTARLPYLLPTLQLHVVLGFAVSLPLLRGLISGSRSENMRPALQLGK